nr:hypothetical protein [Tanacetum cinerariifolium]
CYQLYSRKLSSKGIAYHPRPQKLEEIHNLTQKEDETLYQLGKGCGICRGPNLNKECPLNEEVKRIKEVKYGEFGRSFLNNGRNGARSGNKRTSSDSSDGIATITSKGPNLNKECPLNEEVNRIKEVKYGEFGRSFLNNGRNGARQDLKDDSDFKNKGNLIDKEPNMACTQEENSYVTYDEGGLYHNDLVDIKDKAYKERMCIFLGMTYKKPSSIITEKVVVTRYTVGPRESYTKVKILEMEEMPRTSSNIAMIRANLMKEMDTTGSVQRTT